MNEIIYREINPGQERVKGFVSEDENGDYNIYVNETLDHVQKRTSQLHELDHIQNGDLDNPAPAHIIEAEEARRQLTRSSYEKTVVREEETVEEFTERMLDTYGCIHFTISPFATPAQLAEIERTIQLLAGQTE